jgi:hypothetical protein
LPVRGDDELTTSYAAVRCCAAAPVETDPKQPSEFRGIATTHAHALRALMRTNRRSLVLR